MSAIKFDDYLNKERLDSIKKSIWTLVAKIAVPLYLIYLPFDFYYVPDHKWACLALRLSSVFFLPWAYFLSRYGRTLFQVQFHFILITALFLGLLNGIIFLGNKVEYLYFIGLHMGCVGAMVLIPWEKKFIFWVPTVIYIPYLFSAVSMISSREDVDFVVASFANGLGLIVLLYIVWNYSEKLRRGELHARFSLINEVRDRDSIINQQAKGLAEAKLRLERRAMEERLDNAVGRISRQVFHDLQSPVTALKIVSRNFPMDAERHSVLKTAVERIESILGDLKVAAFGKKRDTNIRISSESLGTYLASDLITAIYQEKIIEHSDTKCVIKFHVEQGAESATVRCQKENFHRLISNLLNNSVEAGSTRIYLRLKSEISKREIVVEVADNGSGIPEDVLHSVFERGVSLKKDGNRGLGLYHAKQCVDLWGGAIRINSVDGEGTTIVLTFPA